jgi:Fe(3+) dicitrate transport protein
VAVDRGRIALMVVMGLLASASPAAAQQGADGGVPSDAGADVPAAGGPDADVPQDARADDTAPEHEAPPTPQTPSPPPDDPPGEDEAQDDGREDDALPPDVFELSEDDVDVASILQDDELFSIDELAIVASPGQWFRTGGGVTSIDQEALETFKMNDPTAVLRQAPGVYVREEDGFGLRPNIGIRGASPERSKKITLMSDGVLFAPAPYSAPAAYFFPLMARMVGVDIHKGPGAIRFGPHTVGGAVNLHTREIPEEGAGSVDVSTGSFFFRKIHAHYGASNEWGGILGEGVYLGTDGFKELDGGGDTGFDKFEGMLKAFVQTPLDSRVHHRLNLKLESSREVSDETYLGLTEADFAQSPYRRYAASQLDRMEWWRTLAQLSYRLQVGADFELVTTAYRQDFDRDWRKLNRFEAEEAGGPSLLEILSDPTAGRQRPYRILTGAEDSLDAGDNLLIGTNARRFVSQGIQTVGRYGFETGEAVHRAEVGMRVHHDQVERNHTEQPFAMTSGTLVPQGPDAPILRNRGSAIALAGHAAYGVTWKGLTVSPGIRTEVIWTQLRQEGALVGEGTQVALLPGVGLHYAITEHLGVLAGVHRGFSPAAPAPDADSGVSPELSVNYEAGVRYVRPEGTLLEAVGFVSDFSNLLATCTASGSCPPDRIDTQVNLGEALVYGAELSASHVLEVARAGLRFPLRGAYSFTRGRMQNAFVSGDPLYGQVRPGDPLPYVPRHQASVRAGVEMDRWGLNLLGAYIGRAAEQAGLGELAGVQTDAYFMLDAAAHYRVVPQGRLYLQLRNITGTDPIVSRRPFGARPPNPFMAMVGFEHAL